MPKEYMVLCPRSRLAVRLQAFPGGILLMMHTTWRLLAVLAVLASTAVLRAEELNWRADYNIARKEAEEKGKPLLIEFYSPT